MLGGIDIYTFFHFVSREPFFFSLSGVTSTLGAGVDADHVTVFRSPLFLDPSHALLRHFRV
jgi:hypothetical protein